MESNDRLAGAESFAGCGHHVAGEDCKFCSARHLSICAALDPDEWSAIDKLAADAHFVERDTVFREGEDAVSVYNIKVGTARLIHIFPDGRRQVTGFALPGDFLGLSLNKTWGFTAEAVTDVTACRFLRTSFLNLVDRKPHLLRRMHEFATHELSLAQDHMILLGRMTAEEKIASFLFSMKKRWERIEGHPSGLVRLPMGRQDIADYLGLTIETVSRTINRMHRTRQLVIVPDGVRLVDLPYFEQIALQ